MAAIVLFAFLWSREVRNPDEPREAETARECYAGDWSVVPEMNGKPFLEHPPLFYWMAAGSMRLCGGPSDFAAKAPAALLGIVALLATWLAAESLLGAGAGFTAALLLLGLPYLVLKFRTGIGDTGLAAFTALSLALFFRAWKRDSWILAAAAGAAAGLAFLCKGLLGFGIPFLVAGTFLAVRRDWKAVGRLHLWLAVLVGLAVAAPWVWALHRETGAEGLRKFFIWNHFGRFAKDADHAQPFWYYVNILWVALPLTPFALAAALHRPAPDAPERDARLAGLCWIAPVLGVLSLASGKRVVYLLPLFPGFAILGAAMLAAAERGGLASRPAALVRGTSGLLRALTLPRGDSRESGRALAVRLGETAGDRPLVAFRVGEGEIGQFAFALRRRLPWAWNEEGLRRAAGDGPAVVFGEQKDVDAAAREGKLSPGALLALHPIGEGAVGRHVFRIYEWRPAR
jgi:4-amino-4-deoxy-L-arabinose transferase-like glycosyltransferase